MKPGTYKLAHDVKNPQPDRRKTRDPRCVPVWEAGTEFLVIERRREYDEGTLAAMSVESRERVLAASRYSVLQFVGESYPCLHEIGPGHEEWFNAIVAALEPIAESREAQFTRLGVSNSNYFAHWLVASNRLTPELFEQLWHEYEMWDSEVSPDRYPPLVEGVTRTEHASTCDVQFGEGCSHERGCPGVKP